MIDSIRNFYSKVQFPGQYSLSDLKFHLDESRNEFLKIIDDNIPANSNVLDIGCGTGFISNLFSLKKKDSKFVAIDFSDAIDYAESFSKTNRIENIVYLKKDFLIYTSEIKFDVIICQGVLHHIPEHKTAIEQIKKLISPNGILVLGLYHPTGKILKRFINLNYATEILRQDQENVPYEITFTKSDVKNNFKEFSVIDQYPKNPVLNFLSQPFQHSKNGGLVTYILRKN